MEQGTVAAGKTKQKKKKEKKRKNRSSNLGSTRVTSQNTRRIYTLKCSE